MMKPVGLVGLGLMGSSIAACLLAAGHRVAGVEIVPLNLDSARKRVSALLGQMRRRGMLTEPVRSTMSKFEVSNYFRILKSSSLVIEAISENTQAKHEVLAQIEAQVGRNIPIGCNTSAIPISILQAKALNPPRIIGIHWAEPAHTTRFLEVICGESTSPAVAKRILALARAWGKEPTLVKRDIRGFITNRCLYALLREALYLVENGYATVADVDRSLRNDLGRNSRGFYKYSNGQAEHWQERFHEFSYQIRKLAEAFQEDSGDHPTGH